MSTVTIDKDVIVADVVKADSIVQSTVWARTVHVEKEISSSMIYADEIIVGEIRESEIRARKIACQNIVLSGIQSHEVIVAGNVADSDFYTEKFEAADVVGTLISAEAVKAHALCTTTVLCEVANVGDVRNSSIHGEIVHTGSVTSSNLHTIKLWINGDANRFGVKTKDISVSGEITLGTISARNLKGAKRIQLSSLNVGKIDPKISITNTEFTPANPDDLKPTGPLNLADVLGGALEKRLRLIGH